MEKRFLAQEAYNTKPQARFGPVLQFANPFYRYKDE